MSKNKWFVSFWISLAAGLVISCLSYIFALDKGIEEGKKIGRAKVIGDEAKEIRIILQNQIRDELTPAIIESKCGEEIRKARLKGKQEGESLAIRKSFIPKYLKWYERKVLSVLPKTRELLDLPDPEVQQEVNIVANSLVKTIRRMRSVYRHLERIFNGEIDALAKALEAEDDVAVNKILNELSHAIEINRIIVEKYMYGIDFDLRR